MTIRRTVELDGHLIDSLTLSKVLDQIEAGQGRAEIDALEIGTSRRDFSYAKLSIEAPNNATLEGIVEALRPLIAKTPLATGAVSASMAASVVAVRSSSTPKILMCPPDYFTVAYDINPWMSGQGDCNTDLARHQWDALYEAITQQAGAEVALMTPIDGLPDLVFTANAAFVHANKAIIASYKFPERQGESPHVERWFSENGYDTVTMPHGIMFEGAGDALIWQDRVFAGYKTRTDLASHNLITAATGLPVLSLELIDPRFYHIDVCICPLADGHFVYYPGSFDAYGHSVIEANIPQKNASRSPTPMRCGLPATWSTSTIRSS